MSHQMKTLPSQPGRIVPLQAYAEARVMYLHPRNVEYCYWLDWRPVVGLTPFVLVDRQQLTDEFRRFGPGAELWGYLDVNNYIHQSDHLVDKNYVLDNLHDFENRGVWEQGPSQVRVLIGVDADGDPIWRYLR